MCPDQPHERRGEGGLSVLNLVQRGGDRTGLRSRSDHDAELRWRRHSDDRELHRHGRRQRGQGPAALRAGDVDRQHGHPYFVFAPINACTGCSGKIYLLEQMSGSVMQSDLGPTHQVVLVYDDTEPFTDVHADAVLPPGSSRDGEHPARGPTSFRQAQPRASSRGIRRSSGDGTVANASVDFTFFVYTSYDGSRGGPNPAALAVVADALHEALCLLQRVGGIRLPTLQLGESCEGP